jgi:hypothetical protein
VRRVVPARGHDLARQHRRQQPDLGQRVPVTGQPDPAGVHAERVPVQFRDRQSRPRRPSRSSALKLALDYAVRDPVALGESRDTHATPVVVKTCGWLSYCW